MSRKSLEEIVECIRAEVQEASLDTGRRFRHLFNHSNEWPLLWEYIWELIQDPSEPEPEFVEEFADPVYEYQDADGNVTYEFSPDEPYPPFSEDFELVETGDGVIWFNPYDR